MNEFLLKTEKFEGPLDLLLGLIEKRKMHISDVSLAQVTDDFIAHVKGFQNLPKHSVANFILIASTLMLIKSLSLLPNLSLTEEEKESVGDLEKRLQIYQEVRRLGEYIRERFGRKLIYLKPPPKNFEPVFTPTKELTTGNIHQALQGVIKDFPIKENLPQTIVKKVISLEEAVNNLSRRIQGAIRLRFSEYSGLGKAEKVDVIVNFLGMLELVKQGIIEAKQDDLFTEIEMENRHLDTPRYE